MTTLQQHPALGELVDRLEGVRTRWWLVGVVTGALAAITVALLTLLAVALAAGYWPDQPPKLLRWGLLLAGAASLAFAGVWLFARRLLARRNPAQTARFIEQAIPEAHNDLINSLLLARDESAGSPELVDRAIAEAVARTRSIDLARSVSLTATRRWGLAALVAALAVSAFAMLQPGRIQRGLAAVIHPGRYVPHINTLELVSLQPGDATVFAEDRVAFVATFREPVDDDVRREVVIEGRDEPLPLLRSDGGRRLATTPIVARETIRYHMRVGGNRWPVDREWHTLTVIRRIDVKGLTIRYDYPAYLDVEPETVTNADGSIKAPVGTEVTVELRLASPAPRVIFERSESPPVGMARVATGDSASRYRANFRVEKDGRYRLLLADESGKAFQQIPQVRDDSAGDAYSRVGRDLVNGSFPIVAQPDDPPSVRMVLPGKDVSVPPGGTLAVRVHATDDHGLSRVALYAGLEGGEPKLVTDFPAVSLTGRDDVLVDHVLSLEGYQLGQTLVYYAVATDTRQLPSLGGFQKAESARFKILVQDAAKVAAAKAKRRDLLRMKLMEILDLQLSARVGTDVALRKLARLEAVRSKGGEIATGQAAIREKLVKLVSEFEFDEDTTPVQQACALLANNEARDAVTQADVLAKLSAMDARNDACRVLAGTQEQILDTLRSLLEFMPVMGKKPDARKESSPTELPPDVAEKYRKLQEKMAEFSKEQRKAIAAAERLVKEPVDNFDTGKALKELQATQDKWEKFLNEAIADFSKLAAQDFSNPAVLKELISVKCDVTMAKDALKQKAVEIATAAEENGLENAKSLTANIEKWLPDVPDRKKWAMEAPEGGQENIEMPELPKELEDLVGDLLEEEEDLFDEADDVTSKATMSGDKGIGWDATDGPISNMNAQGVTGNQLPNNSELQGRSGEGRQGKSSGEFVEDKAVGKGGRRTPTRLSPDPFQKGQVDDKSTDPPGGATGGGKLSGAGEEGLEGPLAPEVKQDLKRLAGRQASLINKAERIRERFAVNDYSSFRLRQAITLMNRVKGDLEKGNYRNALRRRDETLAALRQSKLMLSGRVEVESDTSSPMPKYIRDEIRDTMNGQLPPRYRDVLRQYYKRLSEDAE